MTTAHDALKSQAIEILRANDRGGYTVPTAGLYPFQWNWDAGFTAMGWLTFDEDRAWQELEMLLLGQWPNGMVPHVVFHKDADTYFPGPREWGVQHSPATTSITQPPVLALVARILYEQSRDTAAVEPRLRAMLGSLVAYHRWWFTTRDPENTGLVVTYHPWESGMDNSPAWDDALERVPRTTRPYTRRDTGHVDSSQRPRQEQYDRYVYLLDFFREQGFDTAKIYATCPYRVADISINSILARANSDLIHLCRLFGRDQDADYLQERQQLLIAGIAASWDDELALFVSRDTRSNTPIRKRTTGGLLPILAPELQGPQRDRLVATIREWIGTGEHPYGLASTHPDEPSFDPKRYWRGPSWLIVNWMIAEGLTAYGENHLGEGVRRLSANCIHKAGYYEYFHPRLGEGYGGDSFSWTAAMALFWILPGEDITVAQPAG